MRSNGENNITQHEDQTRFNLRKSDLVRVIVQALENLDYHESAKLLEKESGFGLHSSEIAQFRSDVLQGNWDKVIQSLHVLRITDAEKENSVRFLIQKQKYLEQLENKNTKEALQTLRKELTPVSKDPVQLHKLASLIMCLNESDLQERAKWDGSKGLSRKELIDDLHKYIPPALMVPENRLEKLLLQAIEYQKETCLIGSDDNDTLSLLQEQSSSSIIPQTTSLILEHHTDEVWFVQFSHTGKYMITTSADKTALLYEVAKFNTHYKPITLYGHDAAVSYASFSPDDTQILTCSNDKTIKLWNIQRAECIRTFKKHKEPASSVVWLPDGKQFISAGSGSDKTIRRWSAETYELLESWKLTYKIQDMVLSRDGSQLVVISHNKKIYVYDPLDKHQCFTLIDNEFLTCVTISPDGRFILCNVSREEESGKGGVHMWDLKERRMVREFTGHAQTKYVLRVCFGGKNSPFVISGSEDCKIYIWERSSSKLIAKLDGHVSSVNCVAWNYNHPHMFASASDDSTVRIWSSV